MTQLTWTAIRNSCEPTILANQQANKQTSQSLILALEIYKCFGHQFCVQQITSRSSHTLKEKSYLVKHCHRYFASRSGKRLFYMCCFHMGLPVGLEHCFSTSKWAISGFRGCQNACQDGLCTFELILVMSKNR